jgi:hypothetical protein
VYIYKCLDCGTELTFNKRVTVTKRRCPHCGRPITPEDIDASGLRRQQEEQENAEEWNRYQMEAGAIIRRERAERERLQMDARARQAKHEQQAKRLRMLAAAVVVGVLLLVLAVWLLAK